MMQGCSENVVSSPIIMYGQAAGTSGRMAQRRLDNNHLDSAAADETNPPKMDSSATQLSPVEEGAGFKHHTGSGHHNGSATTSKASRPTGETSNLNDCNEIAHLGMDHELPKWCARYRELKKVASRSTLAECEGISRKVGKLPKRCFLGVGPVVHS